LIANPDRPKNVIANIPFWNDVRLPIENVSPHRKFSAPSQCQVQSLAARDGGSRRLAAGLIPRFATFRHVSGGKGKADRCSAATGMQ
jgi:hypothetical protein